MSGVGNRLAMNPDFDSNSSSDEEQEIVRGNVIRNAPLATAAVVSVHYYRTHIARELCRTNEQTGFKWVCDILKGHPTRCHEQLRMDKDVFLSFCELLKLRYGLKSSRNIGIHEKVAIFLNCLGHGLSNRMLQERFQHSGETISRHF
uniref:DUF8040 domain-containing protein n=1 Tax=Davidia involucrata TaxID=16924 RepID=A0A5B6Z4X2_DAVIN